MGIKRRLYMALGWFFVGLGFLGVFLPLLPTTPFLLLASFFFSRSSKRFHDWLLRQPLFGPAIKDWQEHRMIRTRAKVQSIAMILAGYGFLFAFFKLHISAYITLVLIAFSVITFIVSRPSKPNSSQTEIQDLAA